MKRLARILLNALTVLSLLLLVATVALWVRGYYTYDMIGFRHRWTSARIESSSGNLALVAISFSEPWFEDLGC